MGILISSSRSSPSVPPKLAPPCFFPFLPSALQYILPSLSAPIHFIYTPFSLTHLHAIVADSFPAMVQLSVRSSVRVSLLDLYWPSANMPTSHSPPATPQISYLASINAPKKLNKLCHMCLSHSATRTEKTRTPAPFVYFGNLLSILFVAVMLFSHKCHLMGRRKICTLMCAAFYTCVFLSYKTVFSNKH